MTIQENVSLKEYTTFKTGGSARFFVVVSTPEELAKAVAYAKEKSLLFFMLGGGSNILISDDGFPGVVIKTEIIGKEIKEVAQKNNVEVIAGAGENWDAFVEYTVNNNLYGLENLSLIPGTVGAAPVQNIGAYGTEVNTKIAWVEVFNTETLAIEKLSNEECQFFYRDSIFKKPEGKKYIITRVCFILSKEKNLNTTYKDILEYIKNNNLTLEEITLQKIRDIVIDIRKNKLPDVKIWGTAGSFFKNPIVEKSLYEQLLKTYPEMPHYTVDETQVKLPAGWLLDKVCGFKGYAEGNVGSYKNQALVIVNLGGATTKEILKLAEKMIDCVKEKTGIVLEKEVQIIF